MLTGMSGYSWEGTSSEALFFGNVSEQNAGEVPVMTDDAHTLSLAVAARDDGFEVAPDAPLWLFLPAVWPIESRAWIRDNRVRRLRTMTKGRWADLPWSTADYFEVEADEQHIIRSYGLPPRPPGRVWLLRSHAPGGGSTNLPMRRRQRPQADAYRRGRRLTYQSGGPPGRDPPKEGLPLSS